MNEGGRDVVKDRRRKTEMMVEESEVGGNTHTHTQKKNHEKRRQKRLTKSKHMRWEETKAI